MAERGFVDEIEHEIMVENNQGVVKTKKINGILKGIILSADEEVHIIINSEKGYRVFEEKQLVGTHYFPLKFMALNNKFEKYKQVADDLYLNEKLNIYVIGQNKRIAKVTLRYLWK